jgi:hypothetical protein
MILCLAATVLPAFAQPSTPPALLLFNTDDEASMRAALADVSKAGGVLRHSVPPHVAIFSLPPEAESALAGHPSIELIARGTVNPDTVPASYGRAMRDAVAAWNQVFVSPPPAPVAPPPGARPLIGDARVGQPPAVGKWPRAAAAPPGANPYQTSEYMMGSAAISLILLESSGSVDPNTEDWTPSEQSQVVSECVAGMNWWAADVYPYPVAPLSFVWEYHYAVPTGYEPITRTSWDDTLWITDALNSLGYPCTVSTYQNALYDYVNDLRDNHGTDWVFVVFVVDSSNDADGCFTDDFFAYAWINGYPDVSSGGPFVVMTYDNDGWNIGNMDNVLAHEAGHIFGAADEYCDPGYYCCDASEHYGYLRILNANCGLDPICIMNDAVWNDISQPVCTVTRQQLGWRDSDSDSIPDILDVPPTASLNAYSPDPSSDPTPTFTGSAGVGYFPNQNPWYPTGPDVTLNRIANVQYRVNGGSWLDCTATDGAFDEPTEDYTFTTPELSDATYTFEVQAVDTSGNTTAIPYPSDTLTISGHAITISILADPLVIPSGGSVQLAASATDQKGHSIASYSWDDGGAGGVFLPSATTTGPAYAAPENTTGADLGVTLTLSATCDADPPKTDSNSVTITVKFDFDGDGMPDYWEQQYGFDQTSSSDAGLDADGDGLTNLQEYQNGTDPGSGDTDGDGMPDNWELQHSLNPTSAADASADADHDGLTALLEYQSGSDPADRDSDDDGFGDAEEVALDSDPTDPLDRPQHGHFSDVEPTGYGPTAADPFWAFHEIEACFRSGIVSGYLDGTYQPALSVSRDQMAVYIARAVAGGDASVPKDYTVPSFTDVPTTNWAFHYIEYAAETNVVRGYQDGSYQPLVTVDRGTMAVYIARSIVTPIGDDSSLPRPLIPTFPDVPTQYWSYPHVEYCFAEGVVRGYDDGLYHPEIVVSRDQMAVYICRAFDLPR